MSDARTKTTIRVDGLHPSLTKDNLHEFFIPFGEIIEIDLPSEGSAGAHKGYAHIEYEEAMDAAAALDNMDHAELYENEIRVTPAAPLKESFEGLGSKVPLWEQEGFIQQYMKGDATGDAMTGLEKQNNQGQQSDLPVSVGPLPAK